MMMKLVRALPLDGNKTVVSGVVMILVGVSGMVLYFTNPDNEFAMDPNTAVATIMAGLAVLGIRHSVEKSEEAVRKQIDEK